jgi:glycosyltransferase involved in cell wall biosynthesis
VSPRLPSLDSILAEWGVRWKLNEDRLVRRYRDRPQDLLVSVIMPTWNRAALIRRAIDSVLGQSYRRFELLVADDGSSDGTGDLLERHYRGDDRLRYLPGRHEGVTRTRNRALGEARGELIAYLDSDDTWSEHFLLLSANAFIDDPGLETLYSGVRVVDEEEGQERLYFRHFDREALLHRNFVFFNTFVHTRSLVERLGGFREDLRALDDWEFVLRYTREKPPAVLDCGLATCHVSWIRPRVCNTEDLDHWHRVVREMYREEQRSGDSLSR